MMHLTSILTISIAPSNGDRRENLASKLQAQSGSVIHVAHVILSSFGARAIAAFRKLHSVRRGQKEILIDCVHPCLDSGAP